MTYFNELGQARLGWRIPTTSGGVVGEVIVDADAQAFITAASITGTTQQFAINTLVVQLKAFGIWSKMKALYPMIGGTAAQHRFNLKDPRTVNEAFYLDFNGTWTHTSTGAKPDGTTGYANTKMNLFTTVGATSLSHSTYVRLNAVKGVFGGVYSPVLMGGSWRDSVVLLQGVTNTSINTYMGNTWSEGLTSAVPSLSGMVMGNRVNPLGTIFTLNKNASVIATSASFSVRNFPSIPYCIGALNDNGIIKYFDNNEIAFYHIGDGMTDAEAANFYNAVQTYQTTLGRHVGTPINSVSDSNAQAFIAAAAITGATQQSAINTLVTNLKAASLWSKMKAIYPFVGGTATQHRFNLKDPRTVTAAYYLTFNGGWTHSSLGVQPSGTDSWGDTSLIPSSVLNLNSTHLSVYLTTAGGGGDYFDMGVEDNSYNNRLFTKIAGNGIQIMNNSYLIDYAGATFSNSTIVGHYINNRTSSNVINAFKNNTKVLNDTAKMSQGLSVRPLYLGAHNFAGVVSFRSNRRQAFATIGDGLTDAEALAFYNAVQAYQTTLGRAV